MLSKRNEAVSFQVTKDCLSTMQLPQLWKADTAAPLGTWGIGKQLVAQAGLIFDLTVVARHGSCFKSGKKHPVSEDDREPPLAVSATCCFLFGWEQRLQILSPKQCPALVASYLHAPLPAPIQAPGASGDFQFLIFLIKSLIFFRNAEVGPDSHHSYFCVKSRQFLGAASTEHTPALGIWSCALSPWEATFTSLRI